MPGGRRNAKSSSFKHHHSSDDRHACELPTHPQVVPPKHIPVPDIPASSDCFFEVDSFLFCLLVMTGQYINLYRSIFWLHNSYTEDALNYYLMDIHLLAVNLIMVGRRLPMCFLKKICFFLLPTPYHATCAFCIRIILVISLLPILTVCIYNILIDYGALSMVPLLYPIAVYLIAFGLTIEKFLELKCFVPDRNANLNIKSVKNGRNPAVIGHVCSMSAETIREEVEFLRNDFNTRMKQVIFNSLLVTYHATFLPCYFAQNTLYYEFNWVTQHAVFTALNCFTFYAAHCFPARYCDVLHRAALHLGRWQRVEIKNVHVPYSIWNETSMWNQGALVKHSKELFKAEGISNAAEPGHSPHARFYAMFRNPSSPMKYLWFLQLMLLLALMIVLYQSHTWNDMISIQLLILLNCKTLFKITRVYFVIRKIYYEEKILISKFNN